MISGRSSMKCNVGHAERIFRVGLGIALLAIGGFEVVPSWWTMLVMVIGLIALLTGLLGYCPAWKLFGIDTCHPRHAKSS